VQVTAKLFATLRGHAPPGSTGGAFAQDVDGATTVGDLLAKWRIPEDFPLIIFVNSVHADRERVVEDGDIIAVFPPIAGG